MAFSQKFTSLTGLLTVKNPKPILLRIYKRIGYLLEKMPESAAYRKHTEEIIKFRTSVINSTDDVKVMEDRINCGQIEEVIQQARAELEVAQNFIVTRPWEDLVAPIPKNQWKWPIN